MSGPQAPTLILEARNVTTLAEIEKWAAVARRAGFGDTSPVSLSSINASAAVTTYLSRGKVDQ